MRVGLTRWGAWHDCTNQSQTLGLISDVAATEIFAGETVRGSLATAVLTITCCSSARPRAMPQSSSGARVASGSMNDGSAGRSARRHHRHPVVAGTGLPGGSRLREVRPPADGPVCLNDR
jgi:hypothetical protein